MSACTFPGCPTSPDATNRAGQDVCTSHQPVVITGSGVPDAHTQSSGEC